MKFIPILLSYLGYLLVSWFVFRRLVRGDYLRSGKLTGWSASAETGIFFVHGMLSYLHLPAEFPGMPPLPEQVWLNVLGFSLIGIGLAGTLIAMSRLGFGVSVGQESGGVRDAGFYAWSRNPQIVFYTILILGYGLLWLNSLTVVWIGAYLLTAHWMVTTEEEYLTTKFGQEYLDYCQKVPRYLFRVG